jgi:hypothetical protein
MVQTAEAVYVKHVPTTGTPAQRPLPITIPCSAPPTHCALLHVHVANPSPHCTQLHLSTYPAPPNPHPPTHARARLPLPPPPPTHPTHPAPHTLTCSRCVTAKVPSPRWQCSPGGCLGGCQLVTAPTSCAAERGDSSGWLTARQRRLLLCTRACNRRGREVGRARDRGTLQEITQVCRSCMYAGQHADCPPPSPLLALFPCQQRHGRHCTVAALAPFP